jgi:hypothetical protein
MEIPEDRPTYELSGSTIWISEEGIMYSKPKANAPQERSNEDIHAEILKIYEIAGKKKVCIVSESDPNSKPPRKDQRDFIAHEIESIVKAMAIVTSSPVSRMIANLFFSFKPPTYPVKMFTNERDATEWIRQYL